MDEIKILEDKEGKDKKKEMFLEIPNIKRKEKSKTEEYIKNANKEKIKKACFGAFIIVAVIINFYLLSYSVAELNQREEKSYYIEREIEKKVFYDLEEEPNRDFAWDSELPEFIEDDIRYLKKNKNFQYAKYIFGNSEFYIQLDNDFPILCLSKDEYGYSNFSIYKSKNSIIIYGEDINDRFIRCEIKKNGSYFTEIKTVNIAIAFSEKVKDYEEIKPGYYLCIGQDARTVFAYHEKEVIGEKITLDSTVNLLDAYKLGYPMIYTRDKLYIPYLLVNEKNKISFRLEKVDNISLEEYDSLKYIRIREDDLDYWSLPAVERDNDIIIFMPKNLANFNDYIKSEGVYTVYDESNFEWMQVSIREAFLKAEFDMLNDFGYKVAVWNATIYLNIGNFIGTFEYEVNGYDKDIEIPDTETGLSSYTALSEDEFWEIVEKIRSTYAKYYDYRSE